MTEVAVTPMEPGFFGVRVTEGDVTTSHRVRVPERLVDDLGLRNVEASTLVSESVEFLLEREPPTSIMAEFSLDDIPRFFGDYYEELRRRVGAS